MHTFVRPFITGVVALSFVGLATGAQAQNLIANGGFETGFFPEWSIDSPSNNTIILSNSSLAHSGNNSAQFQAGSEESIAQTVNTTVGQGYHLSFWLFNDTAGQDGFRASVNGTDLLNISSSANAFDWTEFTFSLIATAPTTEVRFSGFDNHALWRLDDVSLTVATPEPGSFALCLLPITGMIVARRRTRA